MMGSRHSFDGSFPSTVNEFMAQVHALFPTIIDTKFLSTFTADDTGNLGIQEHFLFKSTVLGDMYTEVLPQAPVVSIVEKGFENYSTSEDGA